MLKGFLSFFLQPNCPLCDRPTTEEICPHCQQQLYACQQSHPHQFWQQNPPLFLWGNYDGQLKRAIAALKYEQHPEIGEWLGIQLGKSWLNSKIAQKQQKLTVIPIPLHPQRLKERGFNQAEVIAQGFCRVTKYPLLSQGLRRVKGTKAMYGLNPQQRKMNIDKAFLLGKDCQKQQSRSSILLIDDIYTTGITATEAIKVLQFYHFRVLGIAAIAKPTSVRVKPLTSE